MNYHLLFNLPGLLSETAVLDTGWLVMQTVILWCFSAAAILVALKRNRA